MTSPTARSLKWLRDRGWAAGVVEQTVHMPGKPWGNKRDLWGFIDIAAVHLDTGEVAFVQVTSAANLQARLKKAHGVAGSVLAALGGNRMVRVEFHGWSKRGPRGKRKRWTLRRLWASGHEIQDSLGDGSDE